MDGCKSFLARKNIVISAKRYGIDALGAMAQGLFCSLLIGTIIKTLGQQLGLPFWWTSAATPRPCPVRPWPPPSGTPFRRRLWYCSPSSPWAPPPMVWAARGAAGRAGHRHFGRRGRQGRLKETKVDILVTPLVTICVGVALSGLVGPAIGAALTPSVSSSRTPPCSSPSGWAFSCSVLVGIALTLPISSAAICAAFTLTGLAGAPPWPAAAPRWWALPCYPSGRTAGAAW